jgi:hypothetical protein
MLSAIRRVQQRHNTFELFAADGLAAHRDPDLDGGPEAPLLKLSKRLARLRGRGIRTQNNRHFLV